VGPAQRKEKALSEAVIACHQTEKQGRVAACLLAEELQRAAAAVDIRRRGLGVGACASGGMACATG
jgi:hypothetical protein